LLLLPARYSNRKREQQVYLKINLTGCNDFDPDDTGNAAEWANAVNQGTFIRPSEETGGIELTWGNAEAVVQATQEMADQSTTFGKMLALGF
jgi:hypothetical protein